MQQHTGNSAAFYFQPLVIYCRYSDLTQTFSTSSLRRQLCWEPCVCGGGGGGCASNL